MKRTLLLFACVLASFTVHAQESKDDYLPFVDGGKSWTVARSTPGHDDIDEVEYSISRSAEEVNGNTYYKMKASLNHSAESGTYYLREDDRKVYLFDADTQREYLMFDYALKAGDVYESYSEEYQSVVKYEVLSVGDYTEGPEVVSYGYDEKTDSVTAHRRYLRKWVVASDMEKTLCLEPKTWIEGVGSLETPFANLYDVSFSIDHLCYVLYDDYRYLPFSFSESIGKLWCGCNLPTGEEYDSGDYRHQLTYALEGDRLHVYGKVFTQCGPNNYAYFVEQPTDDPQVRKLEFKIQEVEPLMDCMSLHATDFYVPGLSPYMSYIVADNQGEEHPVVNNTLLTAYRPFIEDGKVWKVGALSSGNPVQWVECYYFDGDTLVDGRTCRQMMRRRYVSPDDESYHFIAQQDTLSYVGAWYEESRKVYAYDDADKQFRLMYDFSADAGDTILIDGQPYVTGPRQTGGINGFKGAYRDVMMLKDGGRLVRSTPWLEGVGGIYGMTANVIDTELADPMWFLMSCTVGDEVIYLNDEYEDGVTPEATNARKRFDFTHTIKTQPKSPMRRVAESPLYGEYNEQTLGISLSPLDEAYLVRICDETGKTVYEKAVDAGTVVALSIDISDYAESRYTVTVENSEELFTGEFEAQTTGIRAYVSHEESGNRSVYNLQGQRISALRKGLSIVDGRKVYVK